MSYADRFRRFNGEKQELITRFPVALKASRLLRSDKSPEWVQVIAEETEDVGVDLENVTTLRDQQKVQWINVLYRILSLGDNALWRITVLILIVVNFIQVSYAYIFLRDVSNKSAYYSILVCDVIYLIDYALAVTIYIWRNLQIRLDNPPRNKKTIICDGFLVLPYSFLYEIMYTHDHSATFIILRSISFLRLFHWVRFFKEKSGSAGANHWKYFIVQYFMYFFLLQHTLACVWYLMACPLGCKEAGGWSLNLKSLHRYPKTHFQWYIISMYFALINITNSGIGDIVPTTGAEKLVATLTMALGFTLTTGVFIGTLTSQFVNSSQRQALMRSQISAITKHCNMIGLSKPKIKQIMDYYYILWTKKKGVREANDIKLLPKPLRMEICFDVNFCLLQCSLIFRNKPESFLRAISLKMKHEFYQPGEIIYHQHVIKYKMVCVASGVIEILSDEDNQSPIISFAAGTCIGEAALVLSIPARATMRAACYTEVQVLHKKDFIELIELFPEFYASIRQQILKRVDDAMEHSSHTEEKREVITLSLYVSHNPQYSEIKKLKDRLNPKTAYTFDSTDTFYRKCLPLYKFSENIRKVNHKQLCLSDDFPWILQPETSITWSWETLVVINTLFIGILYPFYIAFHRKFPPWLDALSIFMEIINLIDIYMILTTAIIKKDHTVQTFKGILLEQLNTVGFYLDVFSVFYIEVFSYVVTDSKHWYYILKLNRMLKMYRIVSFFRHLEKSLTAKLVAIRLIKYPIFLTICPYWFGAILYFATCLHEVCDKTGWFHAKLVAELEARLSHPCTKNVVIISVYYALTCLSGLGYGDIPPGNMTDVVLVGNGVLIGIFIFGYCTAEFSAFFTHNLKKKIDFQEALYALQNFMNGNNMHSEIRHRVLNFFVLQWYYNEGIGITSKQSLFYNSTWKIQQDVLVKERMEAIVNIPLFCNADVDFLQLIATGSRVIILPPNVIVTYAGGLSREMYIIQKGYCKQQSGDGQLQLIGPLTHFGAGSLLYGIQSLTTVSTITHVKLISIDAAVFTRALSMFPAIANELKVIGDDMEILAKLKSLTVSTKIQTDYTEQKKSRKFRGYAQKFKGSFLNVHSYCKKKNEDYGQPFRALGNLFWLKYLLLPICILPDGAFIKFWVTIRFITAIACCLLTPYQFIQSPYIPLLDKILFGLDFIAYADLYIMMLVGYYGNKQQLIIHPYKTATHYLKGLFIIDLIFCFPWELIVKLLMHDHNEGHSVFAHTLSPHTYHCLFRSLRVFQVYRLPRAFTYLERDITKKGDILQVLKFVPFTLMFMNFWASIVIVTSCEYFHVSDIKDLIHNGKAKPDGMAEHVVYEYTMFCLQDSWIDRSRYYNYTKAFNVFITALYWSASTLMGSGFGDITPQDKTHLIINMNMIIFGVLFFGYVYASISSHKAGIHSTLSRHQEMLKELKSFMDYEGVHSVMQNKIINYNEYLWKRTGGTEPNIILANLHTALLEDSVLYMYEATLREVPLFEHVERSFFRIIGKELRERYFTRGQTVIRANDVIQNVFIIYRGKVEVISSYNEMQTFMGVGGLFGNITTQSKAKCTVTITAIRNLDALFLTTEAFYSILKRYPSVKKKMEAILKEANHQFYIMPTTLMMSNSGSEKSDSFYNRGPAIEETSFGNQIDEIVTVKSGSTLGATTASGVGTIESLRAFFLPHKWCRIAILPDSSVFTVFSYVAVMAAYVNCIIVTYQFAFQHHKAHLLVLSVMIDTIYLLKMFLEIHKAYIDRYGEYVVDNRKIRRMYFKNKKLRILDFLANIPIYYCAFFLPLFTKVNPYLVFSCLRLITLLRCYDIVEFYKVRSNKLMANTLFLKISTIIMWITLILHVLACIWYLLACPITHCRKNSWMQIDYGGEGNKLSLYILCLYYIMNVLTTTGTGDIVPHNKIELIYITCIMFFTKFFIGMFIGDVTSVLNAYTSSLVSYEYGIEELRDYLHNENVSEHQMEKMWHYVRQLWTRSRGKQIPRIIQQLPYVMRYDLMNEIYGEHLRQSYIFAGTEEAFIRQLTLAVKRVIFFPGNYIVQHGDSDQSMYFIHRGEVDILTVHPNLTETVHDVLHAGEMFGIAQGLYHGVPHHFSFRAKTTVDIITLQLNKWQYLLKFFPHTRDIIYQKAEDVYLYE